MNSLKQIKSEPAISVGLMIEMREVPFRLSGEFTSTSGQRLLPGEYRALPDDNSLQILDGEGHLRATSPEVELLPDEFASGVFTLANVTIGLEFHWQRQEQQSFQGALKLLARPGRGLTVINKIPLESYLSSVISSEMSASCPPELLKAHAVISRSWLLAQLYGQKPETKNQKPEISGQWTVDSGQLLEANGQKLESWQSAIRNPQSSIRNPQSAIQIVRWYGRESHTDFDVCADDHCQRYQGITRAFSSIVFEAVQDTRGLVLVYADEICDARFSKCCGGMTENYRTAWEDVDIPYLAGIYDGPNLPADFSLPLTEETSAERWITGSPPAYCHTSDPDLIRRILPDFDQETRNFFRWEVSSEQDDLQVVLQQKLNIDVGNILGLEPLERGVSGRIVRLKIIGEKTSAVIGKELEIRRALSRTHLYSSAFVVCSDGRGTVPERFRFIGAGWGHGVGLCQIGAAVMAQQGNAYEDILAHYYPGSSLHTLYDGSPRPGDE
ncbi:MAG: SpoIID/LytB domain-containing protein [Acidobacteria bacterium]|nr:SpoIID/LytB domain-containing protein [Acidobacteriota bacterium]